jgi:hypothetical protein
MSDVRSLVAISGKRKQFAEIDPRVTPKLFNSDAGIQFL